MAGKTPEDWRAKLNAALQHVADAKKRGRAEWDEHMFQTALRYLSVVDNRCEPKMLAKLAPFEKDVEREIIERALDGDLGLLSFSAAGAADGKAISEVTCCVFQLTVQKKFHLSAGPFDLACDCGDVRRQGELYSDSKGKQRKARLNRNCAHLVFALPLCFKIEMFGCCFQVHVLHRHFTAPLDLALSCVAPPAWEPSLISRVVTKFAQTATSSQAGLKTHDKFVEAISRATSKPKRDPILGDEWSVLHLSFCFSALFEYACTCSCDVPLA